MTADQIAKMRDYNLQDDGTGHPIADVFSYIFNNELAYITDRDFIITDDDNELIHAIKPNIEDPVNQARYPFKIMTGFYGNIQYTEALYNMNNFARAVKELFLDTSLINDKQYKQIMDQMNVIRNQACIPKAPGPYFKDTIMPVPNPGVPEVRHDGIFHASDVHKGSLTDKINNIVKPLIMANFTDIKEVMPNHYLIESLDISGIPTAFQTIIEGFGEDLFLASVSSISDGAPYKMDNEKSKEKFLERCTKLMPTKQGQYKTLTFFIEAYNTRCDYQFRIHWATEEDINEPEDPNAWINSTTETINNIIDNFEPTNGTIDRTSKTINATITGPVNASKIEELINSISSINGVETITYHVGNANLTYKIGDDISLNNFIEGVINSMPTTNNQTASGTAAVNSSTSSVAYTLRVRYFNEADVVATIGDKSYGSLATAIAAAVSGDTIVLKKNVTASNAAASSNPNNAVFTLPAGVSLDGGGFTITADSGWTVNPEASYGTNHILSAIGGSGMISNVTIEGNQNVKSGIVIYGDGTNYILQNVTSNNNGNCGVQVSAATVTANGLNTSGNTWGAVNVDKSSNLPGVMPSFTFNNGTMTENVEVYTEITDQDVITATGLTKYIGVGVNLKGFVYYTSDVNKLGVVISDDGTTVYQTIDDAIEGEASGTITLNTDAVNNVTIPEGKTVTLNMNGHTITNTDASDTIVNNGTLIINGEGVIDNTTDGKAPVTNNGTMTILKANITRSLDDSQADQAGTNAYYTVVNHGTMVIGEEGGNDSDITIHNNGGYSALIENGWYDSTGKTPENDTCSLTIYSGTFTGGKYNVKNDELGVVEINGGIYNPAANVNLLNWHNMTINGGTITAGAAKNNLANGTYGQGVGHVVIHNGNFVAQNVPNIVMINGYASSDITIDGGTFTSRTGLNSYIAEGYVIEQTDDGKFAVVKEDTCAAIEEAVDAIIDSVESETLTIEADAETTNTYTIITSNGSIADSGIFDQIAAVENLASIEVTDGETTATYTVGGDLNTFKTEVDAMIPKGIDDPEVILTMTINAAE